MIYDSAFGDRSANASNNIVFSGAPPTWATASGAGGYGVSLLFVAALKQWIPLSAVAAFNLLAEPRNVILAGNGNSPFTFAAAFNTSTIGGQNCIYSHNAAGFSSQANVAFNSGLLKFFLARDDATTINANSVGVSALTDGKWHTFHAVNEGDGRNIRLYVDGRQQAVTANNLGTAMTFNRSNLGALGHVPPVTPMDGLIGWAMTWTRALSAQEVRSHYGAPFQAFLGTRPLQPSLLPPTAIVDRRTGNFRPASRAARGGL